LGGAGTITGNVTVAGGGTLAPGVVAPFSTLTVGGNVNFQSGSVFRVSVNDAGQSDKLAIINGGTATLTGGTVKVLASGTAANFAALTNPITILTANGGGLGNGNVFSGVSTNLAFLLPTLSYDPDDVFLTFTLNKTLFTDVALTPNEKAVAAALAASPPGSALVQAVLTQSAEGARQAFDALSGEIYASLSNVQAETALITRDAILDRMRYASYYGAPGDLSALGFGGPPLAYAETESPAKEASNVPGSPAAGGAGLEGHQAYAADLGQPVKAPVLRPVSTPNYTFWGQGFGGWGHVDSDGNAAAVHDNFAGFIGGVDGRLGQLWRAGFAAGYTHADVNAAARASSANIDSGVVGLYAGGPLVGRLNLRGGGTYSFGNIDVNRTVSFPGFFEPARSNLNGGVGQAFAELGYGMSFGRVAVEPLAGLAYVHVHSGSFLEDGGVAALSGASGDENIGYTTLGLRAASLVPLANGTVLSPHLTAQWQYAFGDVTPTAALAFPSTGAAFNVAGVPIARSAALIDAGVDWRLTPQVKLGVAYWGDLAEHAQVNAVKGHFTWDF
jgi:outer membrane autotransporter protein